MPVAELYRICEIAYELAVDGHGRRPRHRAAVRRRARRVHADRRIATTTRCTPFAPTLLDRLKDAGHAGRRDRQDRGSVRRPRHHAAPSTPTSDDDGMDEVEPAMATTTRGLIFANLVDFDTLYGHRNDVAGYAANLERFDARLAALLPRLAPDDLLVITADHGNDPTTPSTDHSREHVPLLVGGAACSAGVDLGTRATFADLGQTLAELFGVGRWRTARAFCARSA